jgi:hypothetical protein
MREDEVEALLKIDSAGLRVHKTYAGYEAEISPIAALKDTRT